MRHYLKSTGLRGPVIGTCQRCGLSGVTMDGECFGVAARSMDERVARLTRTFHVGERVRASETIVYGSGEEIPEGALGTVQKTYVHGCSPLVTVAWDGMLAIVHPVCVESLDPVVVS